MSMFITRRILYDQDITTIEYDVTGQMIVSKMNHTNRKWKLQEQLASIMGINKDLIDLERPQKIPGGVRVRLNIQINVDKDEQNNLIDLISGAQRSGQLANTMKDAWSLSSVPAIRNLKSKQKESKHQQSVNLTKLTSTSGYVDGAVR